MKFIAPFIYSFGASLLLISCCYGGIHLMSAWGFTLFPSTLSVALLGLGCAILATYFDIRALKTFSPTGAAAALLLLLLSTAPLTRHGYAQNSNFLLEVIWGGAVAALVGRRKPSLIACLLLVTVCTGGAAFFLSSRGLLLFSDDHPSFLYRLIQLKEHFPNIPYYNPLWNAGVEAREFFPSGILNLFLIFYPLLIFFEPIAVYNFIVLATVLLLTPCSAYAACKVLGMDRPASCIAALLAIAPSLFWFRWVFVYGTMGFAVSAALYPLAAALVIRVVEQIKQPSIALLTSTALVQTLVYLWSPSIIAAVPLIGLQFWIIPKLLHTHRGRTYIGALLLLNLPWMLIFASASNVLDFVANNISAQAVDKPDEQGLAQQASQALSRLRNFARAANPLLVLFFLPGIFCLQGRTARISWAVTAAWILSLGLVGPAVIPKMELERMFLVLGFMAIPVSAAAISSLLTSTTSLSRLFTLVPLALLTTIPFWTYRIYGNRSIERFHVAQPIVGNLSTAIVQHGGSGRTLFSGFVLHELSNGHIAPLAAFTQRPLVASHYQHVHWNYEDVMPEHFRERKQSGVLEYLDLMNVSSVVTNDRFWRSWFKSRPQLFESRWAEGKFEMFERLEFRSNYFLSGHGEVLSQSEGLLTLRSASESAIIKFRYYPFLVASNCIISPYPSQLGFNLIKLDQCLPNQPVEIRSAGALNRLLDLAGFDTIS